MSGKQDRQAKDWPGYRLGRMHRPMALAVAITLGTATAGCDRPSDTPTATSNDVVNVLTMDRIDVSGGTARLTAERGGTKTVIDFAVPADRIAPEIAHVAAPIGETRQGVLVMQDDYASRPIDGKCGDGLESFVRVFSLSQRRQLKVIPVESCHDGLVAPKPQVTWLEGDRFRIETAPRRLFKITGVDGIEQLREDQ